MRDNDLLLLKALAKVGENDTETLKAIDEAYINISTKTKQFDFLKQFHFYGKALNKQNKIFKLRFECFEITNPYDLRLTFSIDESERITYSIQSYGRLFALTKEELEK